MSSSVRMAGKSNLIEALALMRGTPFCRKQPRTR
jgi:hypothetical protein